MRIFRMLKVTHFFLIADYCSVGIALWLCKNATIAKQYIKNTVIQIAQQKRVIVGGYGVTP